MNLPRLSVAVLCVFLVGCEIQMRNPDSIRPEPDSNKILATVLEGLADVVEHDGNIKPEPRITNTAAVAGYMKLSWEYVVGKDDPMDPVWRAGFNSRFKAIFEPQGEVQQIDSDMRWSIIDFLRQEADALRPKTEHGKWPRL